MVFGGLFALPWCRADLAWLTWLTVPLLLAVVCRARPRRAFFLAWCVGIAGHVTAHYWLAGTLERFARLNLPLSIAALVLMSALNALHLGLFGWLAARLSAGRSAVLVIPALWVALEWLWPTLFPWRLGNTQIGWLPVIQVAEFAGVYGVSFVVMAGAFGLYRMGEALCLRRYAAATDRPATATDRSLTTAVSPPVDDRPTSSGGCLHSPSVEQSYAGPDAPRRRRLSQAPPLAPHGHWGHAAVIAGLLCAAALGWGQWRIAALRGMLEQLPKLDVALIQPDQSLTARRAKCIELSRTVSDTVDLLCWPESSIGTHSADIARFRPPKSPPEPDTEPSPISELDRPLLCAGSSFVPDRPKGPYYNTAFLLDAGGEVFGIYHKRILIPFGEYIPGESWFPWLRELSTYQVMLAAGQSSQPLILPGRARIGVLICYEDLIAGLSRDLVRSGADVLVNLTNDQWFGRTRAPRQHQQLAALRAVETRRYLLRCTVTGSTAVIAPTGERIAQAPLFEPATLEATVHPMSQITLYAQWGDWFAWLCIATSLAAVGKSVSRAAKRT